MRKIDVFLISRHLVVGTFPVCHSPRPMPTPRCTFTPLRSSIWRCARLAALCLLALAAGFLRADRANAQSACAQLGVDCNLPAPPPVSAPVCVPEPGMPCPSSGGYQAPSSTPRTSTPHTPAPPSSATILNNAIQQQVVGTLVQSFFQMLFSNDSKADAQKQQMMQELQQRQAEAVQQHNLEEAQRLAAICNRLQASLKLAGLPELQMKSAGGGGLQLKLGDGGSSSGHAGIRGLPGIALNDTTGNGGTTPYGIPGLPGIYTNGPGSGAGSATSSGPALSMKMDDGSTPPAPPAPVETAPPTPVEGYDTAGTITDVRNMTPKQLADLATKIGNLPPEEQQRLMDAARNSTGGNPPGANPAPAGAAANPSPAGPAANPAPAAAENSNPAASQPAQSQLQQIAATSQSAATAASPEDAAALARSGFDTPAGGSTPVVAISGSTVAPIAAPSTSQPNARSNAPLPPAHSPARASAPTYPVVPLLNMASSSGGAALTAGAAPTPDSREPASETCPHGFEKVIPTREQLQTELAVERAQLVGLQNTIMRFNRTIQLDQQQYAVWEDEATTAKNRVEDHLVSLVTDAAFNSFVDKKEAFYDDLEKDGKLTDFDKKQMSWLQQAKELKSFSEFKEWALAKQDNTDKLEEGARQVFGLVPLSKEILVNQEIQSYIRCGEALIDNAYDLTDLLATMDNVDRLDRNTAQYPEIVRKNGERLIPLVKNINDIEHKLNATPILPPGTPACRASLQRNQ
jgi:hypothetical protein